MKEKKFFKSPRQERPKKNEQKHKNTHDREKERRRKENNITISRYHDITLQYVFTDLCTQSCQPRASAILCMYNLFFFGVTALLQRVEEYLPTHFVPTVHAMPCLFKFYRQDTKISKSHPGHHESDSQISGSRVQTQVTRSPLVTLPIHFSFLSQYRYRLDRSMIYVAGWKPADRG